MERTVPAGPDFKVLEVIYCPESPRAACAAAHIGTRGREGIGATESVRGGIRHWAGVFHVGKTGMNVECIMCLWRLVGAAPNGVSGIKVGERWWAWCCCEVACSRTRPNPIFFRAARIGHGD